MVLAPDEVLFSFRDAANGALRQSDGALDLLRTLIITMELAPGSAIDELALSRRTGYGRTPLREAFHRLGEERLLVILPHRSVAVAPITLSDLNQIYEARTFLEVAAIQLAARRITDAQLATIEEQERSLAQLAESTDGDTFRRWAVCHFRFHDLLCLACGNNYLVDYTRRILPVSLRLNFYLFHHAAMGSDRASNHRAILAALRARDAEAGAAAMRVHIAGAKERLLSLL